MLQIALCDDEPEELSRIETLLVDYAKNCPDQQFCHRCFTSMESLLVYLEVRPGFDLLLLDVCLPEKNGIEAARELRASGCVTPIIFLTSSREYAVEAYEVEALQYLLKPVAPPDFAKAMNKAFEHVVTDHRRYFLCKADGVLHRIPLREIVYSEAQGNYQCLRLTDGRELSVRMTVSELAQSLSQYPDFARCGTPYIVNLAHISDLSSRQLRLETGKVLWIPRGAYAELKERYFQFYCGEEERL